MGSLPYADKSALLCHLIVNPLNRYDQCYVVIRAMVVNRELLWTE